MYVCFWKLVKHLRYFKQNLKLFLQVNFKSDFIIFREISLSIIYVAFSSLSIVFYRKNYCRNTQESLSVLFICQHKRSQSSQNYEEMLIVFPIKLSIYSILHVHFCSLIHLAYNLSLFFLLTLPTTKKWNTVGNGRNEEGQNEDFWYSSYILWHWYLIEL